MATRVRGVCFLSVISLGLLFSVASSVNCPVNPLCTCTSYFVHCHQTCGPSVPKFVASGKQFSTVTIYGSRDVTKVLPETFQSISTTTLIIEHTGISDVDCDAFKAIGSGLETLSLPYNYLKFVPSCSLQHVIVITELDLTDNHISKLTRDAFVNVPNLQDLDLDQNEIESIEKGTFHKLNKLTHLDLDFNKINNLCDGSIFEGLSSLQILSLSFNKIKFIHPKLFDTLKSLTVLNLRSNEISVLDGTTFDQLVNLEEVNLSYNRISSLPENIFANLVKLNRLFLVGNRLMSLPETIFETTLVLRTLWISGNNLSTISHRLFRSTPNLQTLDISRNRIRNIDAEIFEDLSLRTIKIDYNQMTSVRGDIFKGCNQIRQISMRANKIKDLQPGSFRNLPSLTVLDMSENFLSEVRSGVFENSTGLNSLNLADNRISYIENGSLESQHESLGVLNLRSNKLSYQNWVTLTPILTKLNTLISLDLSNNPIGDLPTPVIAKLVKTISKLKLRNCSLTYFPFSTTNINTLDVSSNDLKYSRFALLVNFQSSFNVSGNDLKSVYFRISFSHLPAFIRSINAEHNEIKTSINLDIVSNNLIPISPSAKPSLYAIRISTLDLSYNKFNNVTNYPVRFKSSASVDCDLYRNIAINLLDLSYNNISFVSPEACLGRISVLDLSHNRIQIFSRLLPANTSSSAFQTHHLDLSGNFIHRISSDVFYGYEKIIRNINLAQNSLSEVQSLRNVLEEKSFERLLLSDNPLNCDCESFWWRLASVSSKLDSVRCDTPDNAKGYISLCYPLENCSMNQTLNISASVLDYCKNDIQIRIDNLQFSTLETVGKSVRVNVTWTRHGHGKITGYRLETSSSVDSENLMTSLVHPASVHFIPYGLHMEIAYNVCISAQRENVTVSELVCKRLQVDATNDNIFASKSALIGISSALGVCMLCIVFMLLGYFIRVKKIRFCHQKDNPIEIHSGYSVNTLHSSETYEQPSASNNDSNTYETMQ